MKTQEALKRGILIKQIIFILENVNEFTDKNLKNTIQSYFKNII